MGNSELILFSLCSDENKISFVISILYVYEANANDRKRYAFLSLTTKVATTCKYVDLF